MKIKENLIEGVVIGLTTSIMIIFITFLWNKARAVDTVMYNVEKKIEEVVDTVNDTNKILSERITNLENTLSFSSLSNESDVETKSVSDIDQIYQQPTQPVVYQQQIAPMVDQYQQHWK